MLVLAALASTALITRIGGERFEKVLALKQVLGGLLIVLAMLVLLGIDKLMETAALNILPGWVTGL